MADYQTGNAEHQTANGWFLGHFVEPDSLLRNDELEVKWGHHQAGENCGFKKYSGGRSIAILISGKFEIAFQVENSEQCVILSRRGDYVIWKNTLPHRWNTVDETILVTIRWPSKRVVNRGK